MNSSLKNNSYQVQQLSDALKKIVYHHRNNSVNLPKDRLQIFVELDYTPPLKIEVFWQKDPDLQLFYFYHPKGEKDLEIVIHGPYSPVEISKKLPKLLETTREYENTYKNGITIAEPIASVWSSAINNFPKFIQMEKEKKKERLADAFIFPRLKMGFRGWVCVVHGNLLTLNVEKIIDLLKWKLNYDVNPSPEQQEDEIHEIITNLDCFGTFIHPPVWIGEMKKPTVKQIINQQSTHPERIIETKVQDIPILVENDGFIVIGINDFNLVKQILNILMGLLLIFGHEVDYIRKSDIFSITIDSERFFIRSWSSPIYSNRFQLDKDRWANPSEKILNRKNISLSDLNLAIENLSKINKIQEENLILLSSAFSHLKDADFSQSFINSWVIIEKTLYQNARQILSKENQNEINLAKIPVAKLINMLNQKGQLQNYELLNKLRKTRNGFLHGDHIITKDEAKMGLNLAITMVKESIAK